jgi:hypothetical protein
MRPIQNAGGHVGLTARNYPIAYNTAISAGEVVKLSAGLVVAADANETGPILGIAAENHPGTADALNARANGTEILVYDNPELIFECPAPTFKASGGSATTVTAATSQVACTTADAFNGGYLVSPAGKKRAVTDFANASTTDTFTVPSGETAAANDVYTLYPPIGSKGYWRLDSTTLSKIVLNAAGCTALKVVGHDFERGMIRLKAYFHSLASQETDATAS